MTDMPKVLVVDDDEGLRAELVAMLEEEGFDVVGEGWDGAAAVTLARELDPDVVLLDLRMPTMNGIEATQLIRGQVRAPEVVLLSAYDDATLKESARDAGAFDFLVKGCRAEFVLGVVQLAARAHRATVSV